MGGWVEKKFIEPSPLRAEGIIRKAFAVWNFLRSWSGILANDPLIFSKALANESGSPVISAPVWSAPYSLCLVSDRTRSCPESILALLPNK